MRLGDLDALKDHLEDLRSYTALGKEHAYYRGETNALKIAIGCIDRAPTVDVIPVVRCKDCKHFFAPCESKHGSCDRTGVGCSAEEFYSDGER